MPISFPCVGCKKKLKAPDTAVGMKLKCPVCKTVVIVPSPPALEIDDELVQSIPVQPQKKEVIYVQLVNPPKKEMSAGCMVALLVLFLFCLISNCNKRSDPDSNLSLEEKRLNFAIENRNRKTHP